MEKAIYGILLITFSFILLIIIIFLLFVLVDSFKRNNLISSFKVFFGEKPSSKK